MGYREVEETMASWVRGQPYAIIIDWTAAHRFTLAPSAVVHDS
jgi:hypothetical protein